MRKRFSLVLILMLGIFAFTACDKDKSSASSISNPSSSSSSSSSVIESSSSSSSSSIASSSSSIASSSSSIASSSSSIASSSSSIISSSSSIISSSSSIIESSSSIISSSSSIISSSSSIISSSSSISSTVTESVVIFESGTTFESAYAKWFPVNGASGYNAYYKKSTASTYTQIDTMLIRNYGSYLRVDALGLSAGTYSLKVTAIKNSSEVGGSNVSNLNVISNVREGFAWSAASPNKTASGAYNEDGTLKSDANVLYLTAANINTVTLSVQTGSSKYETGVGFAGIMALRQKGVDKTPLCIRLIGYIKDTDVADLNSSNYIQVKGCYNITIEGVGDDTTLFGWSFLVRDANNIEIRNIGLMWFADDGISLDTDNFNIWIHNIDFFYGKPGSDADKGKGDGSCDTKGGSQYICISYNHFWDSGKCMLVGGTSSDTDSNYITYHHNWYDHTDSRHPRIRGASAIHIYNNYFDGVSKYGVGTTTGSSAFVEANYFRNTKYPMLISKQGSDIATDSEGTFSGETGGMIKAFNNIISGATRLIYANASDTEGSTGAANATQFDAYLALTRDEVVASTYSAAYGASTYSNFDTNSSIMYSYNPTATANVPSEVECYAGRAYTGDFNFEFNDSVDDVDYSVNSELLSKISSYTTQIVSIGGDSIKGNVEVLTAQTVIELIEALPGVISKDNTDAILEVYASYLALDTADRLLVTNYEKLESALEAVNNIEANVVIDLIESIGTVNINSSSLIDAALAGYEGLTAEQQALVTNYDVLEEAIVSFAAFKIDVLISEINSITALDEITLEDKTSILAIKAKYDALTTEEKALITNSETLTSAVSKITYLGEIQNVITLIDAIGEVSTTSNGSIQAARSAYDALTAEQQALITNYSVLTAAEAAYTALASAAQSHNFTTEGMTDPDSYFTFVGSTYTAYSPTVEGVVYTQALKCDSKGSVVFTTTEAKTLTVIVYARDAKSCTVKVTDASGNVVYESEAFTTTVTLTIELDAAGTYTYARKSGESELYFISVQ